MAIQTLNAKSNMRFMRKLDGLYRRLLTQVNSIGRKAEQSQSYNAYSNQTKRLFQPVKKSFDHGCS
jgi:hypothetical protein